LLLQTRGHCLMDNGRADEAAEAYALAAGLAPRDPNGQAFAAHARRLAGEEQGLKGVRNLF
jgi:cytochrome c-type biogenesis protein CcmH/NrfG